MQKPECGPSASAVTATHRTQQAIDCHYSIYRTPAVRYRTCLSGAVDFVFRCKSPILRGGKLLQIVQYVRNVENALEAWGMELMSREPIVTTRESTVRMAVLLGTTGVVVLAGTIAAFMLDSLILAQVSALLAAFLLLPLALTSTVRSYRGARHVLTGAAELDARREELEAEHEEIAARTAEIENRAARVEKQYQILCGLVNERSAAGRPEELEDRDPEGTREALEEALAELRQREASERLLADRIRELESARRRAEQELARLMSESRERLRREREVSGSARERKLARATEDAEESLKVRSAASTEAEELLLEAQARAQVLLEEAEAEAAQLAAQGREEFESALRELKIREDEELEKGGQIIADARIRAAELVSRAEEQAAELVELGEAEFEALLQQISEHEQRERELYERVMKLEVAGSEPFEDQLETTKPISGHEQPLPLSRGKEPSISEPTGDHSDALHQNDRARRDLRSDSADTVDSLNLNPEEGDEILAEAMTRAARIVEQAERRAMLSVEQGEAKLDAVLAQIEFYEKREKELQERVVKLETATADYHDSELQPLAEARHRLVPPDQGTTTTRADMASRATGAEDRTPGDLVLLVDPPSGPLGALRNLFGGFRSRDRSLDG